MLRLLLFFFNDTATTEIYTLSLHDALPISAFTPARSSSTPFSRCSTVFARSAAFASCVTIMIVTHDAKAADRAKTVLQDRKSTRLNSSHQIISYAVFCLKKQTPHNAPRHHH